MRDIETTESELRLVAVLRRAARERGPPPSTDVADALLDERRELTGNSRGSQTGSQFFEQSNSSTGANSGRHLGSGKMGQLGL
jgi:hypothetical protein